MRPHMTRSSSASVGTDYRCWLAAANIHGIMTQGTEVPIDAAAAKEGYE
jgi:hypothetical protein